MNKTNNRLYIFILLLGALCCAPQSLSARRGILSHMSKEDDSQANISSLENNERIEGHRSVPQNKSMVAAPENHSFTEPLKDSPHVFKERAKEPERDRRLNTNPMQDRRFNDDRIDQDHRTHNDHVKIKIKKIGSVSIPQMPTPPQSDTESQKEETRVPKETIKESNHSFDKKDFKNASFKDKNRQDPKNNFSDPREERTKNEHNKPGQQEQNEKEQDRQNNQINNNKTKKEEPKKATLTTAEKKHLHKELIQKEKDEQMVRFYFEDATLENLVRYIEELYNVKFFTDDDLNPVPQGRAILKGHKITFTTNKPLTRTEAWDLFLKFLDMAGLAVVPGQGDSSKTEAINPNKAHKKTAFYRITSLTDANKEVLPTFFDTKLDLIPDNSTKVRYVFFVKNTPLGAIQEVVKAFSSSTAGPILTFPDLNGLIVTDKGSNIRSLMKIIKEFDKEMPEAMSVLKLKKSDAIEVAKLYQTLTRAEAPKGAARFMNQRNQPKALYFPANARIIPEPRTNSLVLLGPKEALAKIEEFITKHVDVELDMPYSPLHIYELQYTQARNIAQILTNTAAKFGSGTQAGQYGGVRDGNQYFGPMSITPDTAGNKLIIKAEENDYDKLVDIIKKLDVVQPQAIVEVLIVDVITNDDKVLGTQIRSKSEGSIAKNMDFQRSGLPVSGGNYGGVVNASNGSLLGNLINLASSAASGATVVSVGNNTTGIWGIMSVLQQTAKTDIISNPFLLATNNYQANVKLGSTRNIATSSVTSNGVTTVGRSQDSANLDVTITPQISTDGSIQMTINITVQDYTSANVESGDKITKTVNTAAIVQNREVLVLGGIIKNKVTQEVRKVPILGDIPGLGWFFKSKSKSKSRSNVLIFVSPQILYPGMQETATQYMQNKVNLTTELSRNSGTHDKTGKDPINNLFFGGSGHDETVSHMNEFMKQSTPQKKEVKKKKTSKLTRKIYKKRSRKFSTKKKGLEE